MSIVTNDCSPDCLGETTGDEVVAVANAAAEKLSAIVESVLTEEARAA